MMHLVWEISVRGKGYRSTVKIVSTGHCWRHLAFSLLWTGTTPGPSCTTPVQNDLDNATTCS